MAIQIFQTDKTTKTRKAIKIWLSERRFMWYRDSLTAPVLH